MKKMLLITCVFGLLGLGLLAGCQKKNDMSMPSTPSAPSTPSTNAPATTNAAAQ